MIKIERLHKSFEGKKILNDISIEFETGKVNMIIGRSGSGKSTISRCIVGLEIPDSGSVFFEDTDVINSDFENVSKYRQQLGMLFQGSALFDSMSIKENLSLPLELYSGFREKEREERIRFCLDKVQLPNVENLYPSELSGGMKKRVGIARAITLNPKYLICDEPNSGLDPKTAIVIDNLIQEITQEFGITTIVVTHDMNSVLEIGDNISFIHEGKVWWNGDKKTILKTDNKELNDFLFPTKLMKQLKQTI